VLLAILDAHSRVSAIPFESKLALSVTRSEFLKGMERFDVLTISRGKQRWVEKTPVHIHYIAEILQWCPEARVLLILRDGRDVAYSIKQRTGSLLSGIERWITDNLAGYRFWSHPQVKVVKYEDLIESFESTVSRILDFMGEKFEEGCNQYYQTPKQWYSNMLTKPPSAHEKYHNQHRNWQINQPLFDGRGRWRSLSEDELSLFYELAGDYLLKFGYEVESHRKIRQ